MITVDYNYIEKYLKILVEDLKSKGCKFCGSHVVMYSKEKLLFQCSWKFCKKTYSPFSDTIFTGNRCETIKRLFILKKWLSGSSIGGIKEWTGISRFKIYRILRELVKREVIKKYYDIFEKIGGNNMIVEVDESKFGKRKYERGHKVEGTWVLGAVERSEQRRIILMKTIDRSAESLNLFLKKFIKNDTIIFSDGWRGYSTVKNYFTEHRIVNHSREFVDSRSGTHTNTIEGCWSSIKRGISFRNRTYKLIDIYILRFMINRNINDDPFKFFIKLLI